ncbi:MAG: response regulator transcription factor [Comamonadaceae bacterium]|nr:MAG: response regulator transcription factor [Comamonadaceae bacterium]
MRIALLDHETARSDHTAESLRRDLDVDDEYVACRVFDCVEQLRPTLRPTLREDTFDLLLLEWNVPDLDGVDLMHWVRNFLKSTMAIVLIGSRQTERDVSGTLGLGADDYVVRPFRTPELCARIERLMAQRAARERGAAARTGWALDPLERSVGFRTADGHAHEVALTEREFRLTRALFRHLGRAVSRSYLGEMLSLPDEDAHSRALDSHIYRLRHKLRLDATCGLDLQTVYGRGYRLEQTGRASVSARHAMAALRAGGLPPPAPDADTPRPGS